MRIDHIACWTDNIDRLADFYARYFNAQIGPLYQNPAKQFSSCFLSFPDGGRLEIMHSPSIHHHIAGEHTGFIHLAISVGSPEEVDRLTETMYGDGVPVLDGPRHTGDGYYESIVNDPDGNRIEITL
ncbi:MAG: hypothetical protein GX577_02345 [Leptolinea sp.]|nr:hypothetical protein [Leptolinea sp.]